MSEDIIKTEEIGDYRIMIRRDEYPPCPCKDWDMLGVHLFDYSDRNRLSEASKLRGAVLLKRLFACRRSMRACLQVCTAEEIHRVHQQVP